MDAEVGPFSIDPYNLDHEWRIQPGLTRAAGRREADARHEHAQAKARLAVCAAALKLNMRREPGKYGLRDRPTQDEVECALELNREYQRAVDAVNIAKRDLDYATADTIAYVDRRKALENHVELLNIEYYSEKEPRSLSPGTRERVDSLRRQAVRRVEE